MKIKTFCIPCQFAEKSEKEMNIFLTSHRILEVEQHFYSAGNNPFWTFCVRYIDAQLNSLLNNNAKEKVDYKKILTEEQFAIFSKMRLIRKQLAIDDAVPAYAILTDEEMSLVAKLPEITLTNMQTINGIGDKKIEKYGARLLTMLVSDETK